MISRSNVSNIDQIIMICGIQAACKGNEAVGEVEFEVSDEDTEPFDIKIPCCSECLNFLNPGGTYSIDSTSDGVVD